MYKKGRELHERRITFEEIYGIKEKEGRVFKVSYVDSNHVRTERIFQYKHNLLMFVENPSFKQIKLYVGDVVYE
ncbi:hypothetical protein PXD04_10110 [Methanosphaera sp. ISO3-F5]|uniref:hypothetical protein n=1 Tax=Methanosphaera sp. ISO3-F5 TaxID=1452353 RepID=UPI002B25DE87|nr:hypothetical protein [Methanosphaera sp. ISO3-F5]WQH64043.1 hypothetical protein PXD04_10110 [Methanosphaera sp. ISO3-F5]